MKVSHLKSNPRNPRVISKQRLSSLKSSLEKFGDLGGFVFNRRSGMLVGAHQRTRVLPPSATIEKTDCERTTVGTVALGYVVVDGERYAYREVDWDTKTEAEAMIAANKHRGEWSASLLQQIISETPNLDLAVTGFDIPELEELGIQPPRIEGLSFDEAADKKYAESTPKTTEQIETERIGNGAEQGTTIDEDSTAQPPVIEPRCKPNQIWVLGRHRLMCGDSTSQVDVTALLDGKKADLVFTDPPYNLASDSTMIVKTELRSRSYGKLAASEWDKNFNPAAFLACLERSISETSSVYICTSSFLFGLFFKWANENLDYANYCVWSKPNPMPSLSKTHWCWSSELVVYGARKGHVFNYPAEGNALSVWALPKSTRNDLHPTQKPLHIPEHAIRHSSNPGQLVVDFFGGSGSTLLACEKTDRRCFTLEIDPHYCDVILSRWERSTNQKATLLA